MYVSPFVQFLGFAEYDYTYEESGEAVQELLPGRGFVRYEELSLIHILKIELT